MWKNKKGLLAFGTCFLIVLGYCMFYSNLSESRFVDSTIAQRSLKSSQVHFENKVSVDKVSEDENWIEEDDTFAEYWRRREKIKSVCKKNDGIPRHRNQSYQFIYVNDKHKTMYCIVPKVGCTNFLRFMLILSGKFNSSYGFNLKSSIVHSDQYAEYMPKLSTYSDNEIDYRMKNYYKFFFVRDPYERILSAYKNKFTLDYNYIFRHSFGRKIVKRYRKNPTQEALEKGHDVKFEEFVQYLVDPRTKKERTFNVHWREYYDLCSPCDIDYDFVGKYETFDTDVNYVLRTLNVSHISFPVKHSSTSNQVADYYKSIPKEIMKKLQKLYQYDLDLFGYSPMKLP